MWRCGNFASRSKSGNRKRTPPPPNPSLPPFTVTVFGFRLLHGHVESQIGRPIRCSAFLEQTTTTWKGRQKGPWPRPILQGEAAERRGGDAGPRPVSCSSTLVAEGRRFAREAAESSPPHAFIHHQGWKEATAALLRLMRTNHPARLPGDKSQDSLFVTFKPPLTFSLICSLLFLVFQI